LLPASPAAANVALDYTLSVGLEHVVQSLRLHVHLEGDMHVA
jgi:hypothetical protein